MFCLDISWNYVSVTTCYMTALVNCSGVMVLRNQIYRRLMLEKERSLSHDTGNANSNLIKQKLNTDFVRYFSPDISYMFRYFTIFRYKVTRNYFISDVLLCN